MKITKIEVQKNNPHRYSLYVDDAFFLGISEDTLLYFNFFENKEVDKAILDEISQIEDYNSNMNKAIKYASRAMKTETELFRYMRDKNIPKEQQLKIIDYLKEHSFIDDYRYTEMFVEEKLNNNKFGQNKIKYLLIQKGVPSDIINTYLKEIPDDIAYDNCLELAENKYNSLRGQDKNKVYQKLFRYLSSRGFNYSEVKSAVDKVMGDE